MENIFNIIKNIASKIISSELTQTTVNNNSEVKPYIKLSNDYNENNHSSFITTYYNKLLPFDITKEIQLELYKHNLTAENIKRDNITIGLIYNYCI